MQRLEDQVATLYSERGNRIEREVNREAGISDLFLLSSKGEKWIVRCVNLDEVDSSIAYDFLQLLQSEKAQQGAIITRGTINSSVEQLIKGKPIHLVDGKKLQGYLDRSQSQPQHSTQTTQPILKRFVEAKSEATETPPWPTQSAQAALKPVATQKTSPNTSFSSQNVDSKSTVSSKSSQREASQPQMLKVAATGSDVARPPIPSVPPNKRRETRKTVLVVMVIVLLLGGGGFGRFYSYGPCGKQLIQQATDSFDSLFKRFSDTNRIANSTARIALSGPVQTLQSYVQEAEKIEVPTCLDYAKSSFVSALDDTVQSYLYFMSEYESLVSVALEDAAKQFSEYEIEAKVVAACSPFCLSSGRFHGP